MTIEQKLTVAFLGFLVGFIGNILVSHSDDANPLPWGLIGAFIAVALS